MYQSFLISSSCNLSFYIFLITIFANSPYLTFYWLWLPSQVEGLSLDPTPKHHFHIICDNNISSASKECISQLFSYNALSDCLLLYNVCLNVCFLQRLSEYVSYNVWRTRMVDPGYWGKEGSARSTFRWKLLSTLSYKHKDMDKKIVSEIWLKFWVI